MSLLWEPKEERMRKIEKLKALASTVDGLPRLLKGVGDEIGKQFHTSLNALQGYQEEQHKEAMLAQMASEQNIMAAVSSAMERQKAEVSEQIKSAQMQTIKSVGAMIEGLEEKLQNLEEMGEETRSVGFGIAEIIQKTICALSEGMANLGAVAPIVSTLKQRQPDNGVLIAPEEEVADPEETLIEKNKAGSALAYFLENRSSMRN